MTNEEACADAVGVPTPLQSKANKMMKRIALAAALCALAGCAVPIHTQAQALCETRVKRITNFEAAYFEYRLNKGESPREAFAAASKQYPNEAGEFLMSPGAVNAMLTLEHNLYGQPTQVAENPDPNWANCGPTRYLVFGAGGGAGGPDVTAPPLAPDPLGIGSGGGGAWSAVGPGGVAGGAGGAWSGAGPGWAASGVGGPP